MRFIIRVSLLLGLWIGSTVMAATYSFIPNVTKRQVETTRTYELNLTAGKENKVYLPAMMSFYGATNEQEITHSEFTYSVEPDSVSVTADDLDMPRKYYCMTWKNAPAEPVLVQQKLTINLQCRSMLYTQAGYPYKPDVLKPFSDYLQDDPKGKVVVSDPALDLICEEILKKDPTSAEEVVELVCDWINDNIKFGGGDVSSTRVLEEKTGQCYGMALLAAAIVRKLEIPADAMKGKFLNSQDGFYHGLMEVYFPDAGWVFYDLSNWQRGFKIPNCLMTAGCNYRIEVIGPTIPQWINGYFCRDKDLAEYKAPKMLEVLPIRPTPETKQVYGVKVSSRQPPKSVRIRKRPLRDLILDTSVVPGVRPYEP